LYTMFEYKYMSPEPSQGNLVLIFLYSSDRWSSIAKKAVRLHWTQLYVFELLPQIDIFAEDRIYVGTGDVANTSMQ